MAMLIRNVQMDSSTERRDSMGGEGGFEVGV